MKEILNLKSIPGGRHSDHRNYYKEPPLRPRNKKGFFVILAVIVLAVILTTLGIRASDNLFGSLSIEDDFCPPDMVHIPTSAGGFCVDKYEASAGEFCRYLDPVNQDETRLNLEGNDCAPVSQKEAMPWRNISQDQARVACAKAGKRLASSEEWMQAALGTPDRSAGWTESDCQVDNNWDSQPGITGSGDLCQSSFGAFDMIGNVWEWIEGNVFDGQYLGIEVPDSGYIKAFSVQGLPVETDPQAADLNYNNDYFWVKKDGARGIARGGYWNNAEEAGVYSAYIVVPPSFVGTGVGFRCVK